jgi:hypothetical protein
MLTFGYQLNTVYSPFMLPVDFLTRESSLCDLINEHSVLLVAP